MPSISFASSGDTHETPIDLTGSPQQTTKKQRIETLDPSASTPSQPHGAAKRRRGCGLGHSSSSPESRLNEFATPSKKKPTNSPASTKTPGTPYSKKNQIHGTGNSPEKRPKRFRSSPPQDFVAVYERALSQRFYVLNRKRVGTERCPGENVQMTGSTGNVYNVSIGPVPSCNCPHAVKGNQCKHVLYVMSRVLHAPYHLVYQRGLLSSELCEVFASAPAVSSQGETSKKRKPLEGDCPICFCELDAGSPETIVWCKAACGQNIHQECFEQWAKTKKGSVTCPFCRSTWESDEEMVGMVNVQRGQMSEGYLNVGNQLGISRERDTSSYSTWFTGGRGGGGWSGRRRRNHW